MTTRHRQAWPAARHPWVREAAGRSTSPCTGSDDPPGRWTTDEGHIWISVEQFEGLLDAAVGRPDVTVTFDDGNISDLEIGLPAAAGARPEGPVLRVRGVAGRAGPARRVEGVRELHRAGHGHRLARMGAPGLAIAGLGPARCQRGRGGDGARAPSTSDG